jgi:hypothetical protein
MKQEQGKLSTLHFPTLKNMKDQMNFRG